MSEQGVREPGEAWPVCQTCGKIETRGHVCEDLAAPLREALTEGRCRIDIGRAFGVEGTYVTATLYRHTTTINGRDRWVRVAPFLVPSGADRTDLARLLLDLAALTEPPRAIEDVDLPDPLEHNVRCTLHGVILEGADATDAATAAAEHNRAQHQGHPVAHVRTGRI